MRIADIAQEDPETKLTNPNDVAIQASDLLGKDLFLRIVAISDALPIWQRVDEYVGVPLTQTETPRNTHVNRTFRRNIFNDDLRADRSSDISTAKLFFEVNQGRDVYTLKDAIVATFDTNAIPSQLLQVLSQLKAIHMETPIGTMKDSYRLPPINAEGQKAVEWFRPKVASFILNNDPPVAWLRRQGVDNQPPEINFVTVDEDVMLRKSGATQRQTVQPLLPSSSRTIPITVSDTARPRQLVRHRLIRQKNNLSGGEVRRLARRAGVRRMSTNMKQSVNDILRGFVTLVVRRAATYAEHANRRTITLNDITYSLKSNGRTLYL